MKRQIIDDGAKFHDNESSHTFYVLPYPSYFVSFFIFIAYVNRSVLS